MAPEIKEALCGLCRRHGWSYGVCWRLDRRDPRLLVMGDGYYEEEIGVAMEKLITQVHLIGEGTIGVAAISGKHHWIHSDTFFEGNAEWQPQFLAGMKTIVIIPLPSFGVAQFGSTEKICETLEFINQVLHQFCQRENLLGNYLDIRDPCEAFSSLVGNTCAERGINSLHDIITKELQDNAEPSTSYARSSNIFHLGSHNGSITHPSEIPIISNPTGASVSVRNPFFRTTFTGDISSFQNTRQFLTSCAESQVLLLPNNNMKFSYSFPGNPSSTYLNANSWVKEIAIPPLLPGPATTSLSSSSRMNPFQYSCGNSISPHGTGGSQVMIQGPGKLVDSLSSSPSKSSSKSSSIASEPPDNFLSFPQDSTPQHSALFQFKDDQTSDQIDPCERSSVQIADSITLATEDNTACVQSEAISCSQSTDPPHKPVEISVTNAMNSADTGCDRKGSTSNRPSQLLDNDLFEGMELDLSRGSLRQDCWDDIIMPVNRSSCSNLSASVSDCISEMDMASLATADKGLFSGPSFEQLLEAVVGESVNLSTSHGSTPVNVNVSSVSGFDFDRQISTVRRVHCPQSNSKLAPPAELNLEKMIQESSKEALPKSYVSSWIDDSCTVNAESAVTNQAKKPEETPKVVRKRARPGESTRPRPKDRQQIQDRVKELREIVPNGAKCSIDSLLDRTIKHMLFLQSVTKYADKLKQTDELKMIGDESGVVLKDNSSSCAGGGGGGATWAYEVAGQTMVCPILVEDLNPPGQMLVEMLCEERGFFLEIADIIRGFGLTILKGLMEVRDSKIWARFLVEANRNVTRVDIFLSLVQLLQQTSSIHRTNEQQTKALDNRISNTFTNYQQPQVPIPISLADSSQ